MARILRKSSFRTSLLPMSAGIRGTVTSLSAMTRMRDVFKTQCLVCFAFIICYSPSQWFYFLATFGFIDLSTLIYTPVYNVCIMAVCFSCCINPLIYAINYHQLHDSVRKTFCAAENAVILRSDQFEESFQLRRCITRPLVPREPTIQRDESAS